MRVLLLSVGPKRQQGEQGLGEFREDVRGDDLKNIHQMLPEGVPAPSEVMQRDLFSVNRQKCDGLNHQGHLDQIVDVPVNCF